jgi:anti-anti-sigma regulatory factor
MELRVTMTEREGSTTVYVDGRLTAGTLGELERLVRAIKGPVVIDLSNLLSADDAGVAQLRTLARQGARLFGASPYVALLLEDERGRPGSSAKGRRERGGRL